MFKGFLFVLAALVIVIAAGETITLTPTPLPCAYIVIKTETDHGEEEKTTVYKSDKYILRAIHGNGYNNSLLIRPDIKSGTQIGAAAFIAGVCQNEMSEESQAYININAYYITPITKNYTCSSEVEKNFQFHDMTLNKYTCGYETVYVDDDGYVRGIQDDHNDETYSYQFNVVSVKDFVVPSSFTGCSSQYYQTPTEKYCDEPTGSSSHTSASTLVPFMLIALFSIFF